MNIDTFYVDGIRFPTLTQAEIVAERLFNRYDGYRTITIVNDSGEEYGRIEATKSEDTDDLTIDWIT